MGTPLTAQSVKQIVDHDIDCIHWLEILPGIDARWAPPAEQGEEPKGRS